jgi:hypothetical protein
VALGKGENSQSGAAGIKVSEPQKERGGYESMMGLPVCGDRSTSSLLNSLDYQPKLRVYGIWAFVYSAPHGE